MFPVQDYYLEIDLYVWLAYASTVLCSSRQVMRTALCRAELRFYSATEATVAVAQRHTPYATLTAAQQARRVHRGEQPYCCSVQAPFPPAACLPACCLPACLHVCLFAYLPAPASLPRPSHPEAQLFSACPWHVAPLPLDCHLTSLSLRLPLRVLPVLPCSQSACCDCRPTVLYSHHRPSHCHGHTHHTLR
jgi:hypothetical protein